MFLLNKKLAIIIWVAVISANLASAQSSAVKVNSASGQTKASVPTSIDRQFKRDAARLALRLDAEKEDVRYLPVGISRDNLTPCADSAGA